VGHPTPAPEPDDDQQATEKVTPLRPLEQIIREETSRTRRRRIAWVVGSLALVAAALAIWWVARPGPAPLTERFELATLERGTIAREVVATGRVEARGVVEVGAEVAGRVASVEVDYDDHVDVGQVLLRFDPETLDAQVAQARASVASARANLAQAEASLLEAERRQRQSQRLHLQGFESHEDYEAANTAVDLAEAQRDAAKASLAAQRASFELTRSQAAKAVIEAPISGVVLSRYVDPGQTVVATFQTVVLFVIAEDLRNMEVLAPIDEADIGEVRVGQRASFTVDAYPRRRFEAVVTQVRNEAKLVQNVVTYDAVLEVANPELELRPGMTAAVRIETARADDVVRIPNAALRFIPPAEVAAPTYAPGHGVWVIEGDGLRRINVEIGVANSRDSALESGPLAAGDAVIVELSEVGRTIYGVE
jgi:HlyD family secretion protein